MPMAISPIRPMPVPRTILPASQPAIRPTNRIMRMPSLEDTWPLLQFAAISEWQKARHAANRIGHLASLICRSIRSDKPSIRQLIRKRLSTISAQHRRRQAKSLNRRTQLRSLTPIGRLDAAEQRLDTTIKAIRMVLLHRVLVRRPSYLRDEGSHLQCICKVGHSP